MQVIGAIIFSILVALVAAKIWKREPEPEPEEETDFDLLTVSEKIEVAKQTKDNLDGMEQLVTEMQICSEERQTVVRISWTGEDGETHEHDLFCNGTNTATECLAEIAEREAHDLRRVLAYQCNALAGATRGRGRNTEKIQDGVRKKTKRTAGEW